jgi:predicted AAA+ superfamily ATPase
MLDETIAQCILEFFELGLPPYVVRDVNVPFLKDMVTTIVGGRKVGKTYLTYQAIDSALEKHAIKSLRQVCYLHFDDERLLEMTSEDLRRIDKVFLELTESDTKSKLLFVFDEIHRVDGWEYFVLRLNRNPNWRVLVTGSSSDLEEDKVGKQVRGKTLTVRLHPLSFSEFLRFKGQQVAKGRHSVSEAARISRLFKEYMRMGSYPAIPGIPTSERREVLRQYFNSIVASDFVENRKISHPLSCKIFLRNLMQRNACAYTHKKERNVLLSMGHKIAPNSIADWFNWAQGSYFLGVSTIDSPSIKRQEQNYRKIYAVDWALANAVSSFREPRTSRALESIVYWHLQRQGFHVTYDLVGPDKHEIDFLVSEHNKPPHLAIQVSVDLSSPDVLHREVRAFAQLGEKNDRKVEPLVLTLGDPPRRGRTSLPMRNAWRWILENR